MFKSITCLYLEISTIVWRWQKLLIHFLGPPGVSLSICEAFVYTDQALPIERCPTFRDQPPGSTATYNGKCYIFYNSAPTNFQQAMEFCNARGGTLVDDSNPALQGFLSWELWRRHKVRVSRVWQHIQWCAKSQKIICSVLHYYNIQKVSKITKNVKMNVWIRYLKVLCQKNIKF